MSKFEKRIGRKIDKPLVRDTETGFWYPEGEKKKRHTEKSSKIDSFTLDTLPKPASAS